jgi:ring-1,2-phenylacetyl-CoA epoxidase subunit PaaE
VKLKGEVSHFFYQTAKIGDVVESLLPVGDFTFVPNRNAVNQYVMVAGGSGITPLYSMIIQMIQFEPKSKVTLLYANRNEENIIFKKELHQLVNLYPQFEYIDFVSGNKRIEKKDLAKAPNTQYFICGPDALKDGISQKLHELNVSKEHIHIEHFADGYKPWFGIF